MIRIKFQDFLEGLKPLYKIVDARSPARALSFFKLVPDPESGIVQFIGTDVDFTVSVRLNSDCDDDDASCLLPFPGMMDALDRIKDTSASEGVMEIDTSPVGTAVTLPNGLFVQEKAGHWPSLDAFPAEELRLETKARVSRGGLLTALNRTRFFMSVEQTRYYLNGVFLRHDAARGAVAIATQGHMLSEAKIADWEGAPLPDAILPATAAHWCRRQLTWAADQGVEDVLIGWEEDDPKKMSISVGRVSLLAKLIDGTYPDYQKVFPKDTSHSLHFDADRLSTILQPLENDNPEQSPIAILDRQYEGGSVLRFDKSSVCSFDLGVVPFAITGDARHFACRSDYILRLLDDVSGPVSLHMKPFIDEEEDSENWCVPALLETSELRRIAMPVRV